MRLSYGGAHPGGDRAQTCRPPQLPGIHDIFLGHEEAGVVNESNFQDMTNDDMAGKNSNNCEVNTDTINKENEKILGHGT